MIFISPTRTVIRLTNSLRIHQLSKHLECKILARKIQSLTELLTALINNPKIHLPHVFFPVSCCGGNGRSMSPAQADMMFLENAKKLSMYGVDLHQAKVRTGAVASHLLSLSSRLLLKRKT